MNLPMENKANRAFSPERQGNVKTDTSKAEANAFEYLCKRGWSLQGAMAYVKANPDFVKAVNGEEVLTEEVS